MKRLFNLKSLSAAIGFIVIILFWVFFAPVQIGGQAYYLIINGNSMLPLFHRGDLVVLHKPQEYHVGDIAAYQYPNLGVVFHRIIGEDAIGYIMQGDHNTWVDGFQPESSDFIGKFWFTLKGTGQILVAIKSPWKLALISGAFCLAIGLSMLKRTEKKNKQTKSSGPNIIDRVENKMASWRDGYWWTMYAIGLLALVLGIISFTKPLVQTIANKIPFDQSGVFSYSGFADKSVYDTSKIVTGEPVFMAITCNVNYMFDYVLSPADSFTGGGSYQLVAVLQGNNGWKRTFNLTSVTNFTGNEFYAKANLNVCNLRDIIASTESITEVQHLIYSLILSPNVKINGQFMGQELSSSFDPNLSLTIDQQQVFFPVATGLESDPFKSTSSGFVEMKETGVNTLRIFSWELPVKAGREIAVVLFSIALIGILLPVMIFKKSEKDNERLKARLLLGQSLLETKVSPISENERVVDLTSLEDLAQLADRSASPVFFNQKTLYTDYLVRQENLVFRFRQLVQSAPIGEENELHNELINAIKNHELVLYYQPIKSLQTGKIFQIEALVRWNHPTKGFLTAKEFLPLAEINSVVNLIDSWVLETACAQLKKWQETGFEKLTLTINIFAQQLKDPSLARTIEDALLENQVKPNRLSIEISIDQLVFDATVLNNLKNIKQLGVLITVKSADYSSMDKLYKLENVDHLKIGQPIVEKVLSNHEIGKATQQIIDGAHKNKIEVIAAGVETAEQMGFFELNSCDEAQGYLVSHPLSINEVEALLRKHS